VLHFGFFLSFLSRGFTSDLLEYNRFQPLLQLWF
jgi:hypothetical protein